MKTKKICFVIMGFGKKTDYSTGNVYDLDKTYQNIILPSVKNAGFECVRADEIQDSSVIDKSMYALLIHADLVIADITTYNPNAIYELGIRHAVKPQTTIIIKEEDGKIPFDLDHSRIFKYKHLGEDIGTDESKRCIIHLTSLIKSTTSTTNVDSPLYEFIKDVIPQKLSKDEYELIINDLAEKEKHIFAIVEKARKHMQESNFSEAKKLWEKASNIIPNDPFFIQQYALSTYKSKEPSERSSLTDAITIINKLNPEENTTDPETLGLTGAIYKRLWLVDNDIEYLKRAILFYEKGFNINDNYYTGENYALCLDMLRQKIDNSEEKIYYKISAKKIREKIIKNLEELIEENEDITDKKWIYATLANCNFSLGNKDNGNKYEKEFFDNYVKAEWEKETYLTSKKQVLELI
ncbi:TRAFs-binding domain-containing protein [Aliarcobacter butzleri]|uniref:TRAFs-binding domain-containing protein n=1 Tax=Aliarcobacter butzleri TaxID=28197 RepID=A0AAW7Q8D4_9BACT|nr:TRAFs-binding domain-containing protein [Aliarcobacter butzleri]MDN5107217.1 TRAFs-binding domain-containing protein [Aliarcobacter butzleri]MDN5122341.1 TRAFs-binding domain-containing protein [Aliarcobacter butzleri]